MNLTAWRAWRRHHYADGEQRDDELGWLLLDLLSTRRGAIEVIRAERRYAKFDRPQHTAPAIKDAGHLHQAYGRKRGPAVTDFMPDPNPQYGRNRTPKRGLTIRSYLGCCLVCKAGCFEGDDVTRGRGKWLGLLHTKPCYEKTLEYR